MFTLRFVHRSSDEEDESCDCSDHTDATDELQIEGEDKGEDEGEESEWFVETEIESGNHDLMTGFPGGGPGPHPDSLWWEREIRRSIHYTGVVRLEIDEYLKERYIAMLNVWNFGENEIEMRFLLGMRAAMVNCRDCYLIAGSWIPIVVLFEVI